jgi:glycosyltransferase involved in cell wall biosynthesis
MARLGWQSLIYCCPGDGLPETEEECEGVRVLRFSKPGRNPFRVDPHLLNRLSRNEDQIDLLLIYGMFHPPCVAVGAAARKGGIPSVVCPHSPYHPALLRKNRWKKLPYSLLYERPLLNGASAVQVFCDRDKVFLSNYGVRTRALVVPDGFDPQEVPEGQAGGSRWEPSRAAGPRVLYLGKLRAHVKGLDLLLKALSIGIHDGKLPTSLRLDLVGPDWGDQRRLEDLAARLRISDFVRFVGGVPPAERWDVISSHDIVVLPSRWDGFGLPVLEAMVMAKPVVVSEEAGVSDYVKEAHCGYLIQPNVDSVYAGLVRAVEERDEWPSMGARGRDFAYERLTWAKVTKQASVSYEELLHDARGVA